MYLYFYHTKLSSFLQFRGFYIRFIKLEKSTHVILQYKRTTIDRS